MVEWLTSEGLVPYDQALAFMEDRVEAIHRGEAGECVWLLEHPPLYTAGTSARPQDLTDPHRFPVHQARRGGQYTYHGPGQRIAYVMLDLARRDRDVRAYVHRLERWIIAALAQFNVRGEVRDGRVGVWVARPDRAPGPDGARTKTRSPRSASGSAGVSFHGISMNVEPDLSHFDGIVPCGIRDSVTSSPRPRPAADDDRPRRGAEGGLRAGLRPRTCHPNPCASRTAMTTLDDLSISRPASTAPTSSPAWPCRPGGGGRGVPDAVPRPHQHGYRRPKAIADLRPKPM
ncbi:MAG: lipoyl(octanoyl) transferase LipB [Paracoccaceae bacterium]